MLRYSKSLLQFFEILRSKKIELYTLMTLLAFFTMIASVMIYVFEGNGTNPNINGLFDAVYWALVTISTVGYGDISPVTDMGKIVAMVGIVFGIAMISFVTSVMVSAFSERFDELRNQDALKHANKMQNVVIINGYGHLGRTIAKKLEVHKDYEPVIVEANEAKATRAIEDGYNVICADGSSAKLIKALYQKNNIAAMLTLTSSDINNIYFILNAKSMQSDAVVYSRINNLSLEAQYKATNVNALVEPYSVVDEKAFIYLKAHGIEHTNTILFFGYTYRSMHLCKLLLSHDIDVHIYDIDEERIAHAKRDGFPLCQVIENYTEKLKDVNASLVVCAMDDEALNVYYAITLKSTGFKNEIIALSDTKEDNRKLYLSGVDKIFDMYEASAECFVELIENKTEKV